VKVVGGQILPWADNQVGAYVAAILPGSVADQLHGELHEGTVNPFFSAFICCNLRSSARIGRQLHGLINLGPIRGFNHRSFNDLILHDCSAVVQAIKYLNGTESR
jgi:hypothetical protein